MSEPIFYDSNYDDGSSRQSLVTVEGMPGLWPSAPGIAACASDAEGFRWMMRDAYGDDIPQAVMDTAVRQINNLGRVRVEQAWDMAEQEAPMREALPTARRQRAQTAGAYAAFLYEHGILAEPTPDNPQFFATARDLHDEEVHEGRLGPDLMAVKQELHLQYQEADLTVRGLVGQIKDVWHQHARSV